MNKNISYSVPTDASVAFKNNASFCIGTGRMGLALQRAYQSVYPRFHLG